MSLLRFGDSKTKSNDIGHVSKTSQTSFANSLEKLAARVCYRRGGHQRNRINDRNMASQRPNGTSPLALPSLDSPSDESVNNESTSGGEIMDGDEQESPIEPPPPPPSSPPSVTAADSGRPPLSPPRHSRSRSVESQVSEVTYEGSPKGFSWDSKKVASEIDEASREEDEEEKAAQAPAGKPNQILTLSEISKTCPVEEEAQKLIIKTLDEKKERPKMGSNILPHCPETATPQAFEAPTPVTTATGAGSNITHVEASAKGDPLEAVSDRASSLHVGVPSSLASSAQSSATHATRRPRWGILGGMWGKHEKEAEQLEVTSPLVSSTTQHNAHGEDAIPGSNAGAFIHNANILFKRSNLNSSTRDIEQGNDNVSSHDSDPSGKNKAKSPNLAMKRAAVNTERGMKNEVQQFDLFLQPRKKSMASILRVELLYIVLPLSIVAAILFYGTGNPMYKETGASVSWVLLFAVRNVITFSLGKGTSIYFIDYLTLRRRFTVKVSVMNETICFIRCYVCLTHISTLLV